MITEPNHQRSNLIEFCHAAIFAALDTFKRLPRYFLMVVLLALAFARWVSDTPEAFAEMAFELTSQQPTMILLSIAFILSAFKTSLGTGRMGAITGNGAVSMASAGGLGLQKETRPHKL